MTLQARLLPLIVFGALFLLLYATFGSVFDTKPFEGDNLYILQWANSADAGDLLPADPNVYPEWRPLAYATVWLQYRWAAVRELWAYYLVNILLWTACGWLIYRIVSSLTSSHLAGFMAASFVLTSRTLISSLVLIVDRQSSLACLFGLLTWLVCVGVERRRLTRLEWVTVAGLLLASALSKEYGLGFAVALTLFAAFDGRRDLAAASVAALVLYVGLRVAFASGGLATYCEDHGFFFTYRTVCFGAQNDSTAAQAVYNIVATGLETLLPGLFASDGVIDLMPRRILVSLVLLSMAFVGWKNGPTPLRLSLLIVAVNALQSFLLFRTRNHVVALCAMAVAVGVGLSIAGTRLRAAMPSRSVRAVVFASLLALLFARARQTHLLVQARVEESSVPDACAPGVPAPDTRFMRLLWRRYGMNLPECSEASKP